MGRLTNGETDGITVAVLRPCEIRAFVELVKLNQGSMDNVLLIGVDCLGAVENMHYTDWLAGRNPEEASRDFLLSGGQGPGAADLAKACRACEHPVPHEADLIIGTFGADMNDYLPLVARTPRGEGLINRLGLPDAGDQSARQSAVQQLIEQRTVFRDAMFEETSQAVSTMPKLAEYLSNCINCYNCRVACPVCYCKECVFVTDVFDHKPWQYQSWAQTRGAIRMPTDTPVLPYDPAGPHECLVRGLRPVFQCLSQQRAGHGAVPHRGPWRAERLCLRGRAQSGRSPAPDRVSGKGIR